MQCESNVTMQEVDSVILRVYIPTVPTDREFGGFYQLNAGCEPVVKDADHRGNRRLWSNECTG
jgi:hypothetical protein